LANKHCDLAPLPERIIAKRTTAEAKPNLFPNVEIPFVSWKKPAIGLSCLLMAKLSHQRSFQLFAKNATN